MFARFLIGGGLGGIHPPILPILVCYVFQFCFVLFLFLFCFLNSFVLCVFIIFCYVVIVFLCYLFS